MGAEHAAHGRLRRLAALFGISKCAADPIIEQHHCRPVGERDND
ncbi:hypothetical protein [Streptomyces sp. NPDC001250]